MIDTLRYRGALSPAQVDTGAAPAPGTKRPSVSPSQDRLVPVTELARRTGARAPDGSTATPLRTLTVTWGDGSFAPARTAAVGPDGTVVALTSTGRMARWNPEDGDRSTCVALAPVFNAYPEVERALVTADGTLVTAARRDGYRLEKTDAFAWKADGTLYYRLGGHKERITALAQTANGTVATASWDGTLRTHVRENWGAGLPTSSSSTVLANVQSTVMSMAFAPDGALFTVSNTGLIKFFHRPAGAWKFGGMRLEREVSVIAAGPGTDFITGGDDGLVKLWPRKLRQDFIDPCPARRIFTGHKKAVTAVAADPAGRIVSASEDATVKLWQPSSGDCLATFVHPAPVRELSIAPNGNIVTCADDGIVREWRYVPWIV